MIDGAHQGAHQILDMHEIPQNWFTTVIAENRDRLLALIFVALFISDNVTPSRPPKNVLAEIGRAHV